MKLYKDFEFVAPPGKGKGRETYFARLSRKTGNFYLGKGVMLKYSLADWDQVLVGWDRQKKKFLLKACSPEEFGARTLSYKNSGGCAVRMTDFREEFLNERQYFEIEKVSSTLIILSPVEPEPNETLMTLQERNTNDKSIA